MLTHWRKIFSQRICGKLIQLQGEINQIEENEPCGNLTVFWNDSFVYYFVIVYNFIKEHLNKCYLLS